MMNTATIEKNLVPVQHTVRADDNTEWLRLDVPNGWDDDFRKLEDEGLVRMRAEPESESYFDSYGEPEAYTDAKGRHVSAEDALKDLVHVLDLYGCWWTCSEVLVDGEWEMADSCGMHTGYKNPLSPLENCYVVDEMQAALDKHSNL